MLFSVVAGLFSGTAGTYSGYECWPVIVKAGYGFMVLSFYSSNKASLGFVRNLGLLFTSNTMLRMV